MLADGAMAVLFVTLFQADIASDCLRSGDLLTERHAISHDLFLVCCLSAEAPQDGMASGVRPGLDMKRTTASVKGPLSSEVSATACSSVHHRCGCASLLWLLLGLGDDGPTIPQYSSEHPFICLPPPSPSLARYTLLLRKKGCCSEGESENARVMIRREEF